jgi:TRAP-type C4-dicarboxylate transport system permease small subunit
MRFANRFMRGIETGIEWMACILAILMVINTAGGVFFRYVLHNAIPWTEELGRYMMIYVGMFGCVLAMRDNSHVGVEMFTDLFRPGAKRVFQIIARLVIAFFLVVILVKTGEQLSALKIQRSSALEIPMVIPYAAVTVGIFMMLIEDLAHLLGLFKRPASDKPEI